MFGRRKKSQAIPEAPQPTYDNSWHCDGTCQNELPPESPEAEKLLPSTDYAQLAAMIRQNYSSTNGHVK